MSLVASSLPSLTHVFSPGKSQQKRPNNQCYPHVNKQLTFSDIKKTIFQQTFKIHMILKENNGIKWYWNKINVKKGN